MKKTLVAVSVLSSAFLFCASAYAEGAFEEQKANLTKQLVAEKGRLETEIACVKVATKAEELQKCQADKKAAVQKAQEDALAARKARLQEELKKVDAAAAKAAAKPAK